jgi:ABC-type dipeptide/oligopeptide/nickel transport system permease subunit
MDSREGRVILAALLFGMAPILVTAAGPCAASIAFAVGLLVGTTAAFA